MKLDLFRKGEACLASTKQLNQRYSSVSLLRPPASPVADAGSASADLRRSYKHDIGPARIADGVGCPDTVVEVVRTRHVLAKRRHVGTYGIGVGVIEVLGCGALDLEAGLVVSVVRPGQGNRVLLIVARYPDGRTCQVARGCGRRGHGDAGCVRRGRRLIWVGHSVHGYHVICIRVADRQVVVGEIHRSASCGALSVAPIDCPNLSECPAVGRAPNLEEVLVVGGIGPGESAPASD